MTREEYKELSEKLKNAEIDDTPFPVLQDGELAVVGDANKTEVKIHHYDAIHCFPNSVKSEVKPSDIVEEGTKHFDARVKYRDVQVVPRNASKIIAAATELQPFFLRLEEDGEVSDPDEEELNAMYLFAHDELVDAMYRLVKNFLDITDEQVKTMLPAEAFRLMFELIEDFPEVFNESNLFFGSSTGNR